MKKALLFLSIGLIYFSCNKENANMPHYDKFSGKWKFLFTKKITMLILPYYSIPIQSLTYPCEINFDNKFQLNLSRNGKCTNKYKISGFSVSTPGIYPTIEEWDYHMYLKDGQRITLIVPNIPRNTPSLDTLITVSLFPFSKNDQEPNIEYWNYYVRE